MTIADLYDPRWYDEREKAIPWPAEADRGHCWEAHPDGEVALYTAEDGDGKEHDSVRCARCGEMFCVHCHAEGPPEECDGELA